jgi:hypothetical protein
MFHRVNPNYMFPRLANTPDGESNIGYSMCIHLKEGETPHLSPEQLVVTPPVVYGYAPRPPALITCSNGLKGSRSPTKSGVISLPVQSLLTLLMSSTPSLLSHLLLFFPFPHLAIASTHHSTVEFDITKVAPVSWNADAFANLVVPDEHKNLLRSLIVAHHEKAGFDDFIRGKGAGLVVNLFGPPGVGESN